MKHIGSEYGGYLIPENIKDFINQESCVISCGIGYDTTFDEALHELTGCNVIMFDPSEVTVKHLKEKDYDWVFFSQRAISDKTDLLELYEPADKENYTSLSINNKGEKLIVKSLRIPDIRKNIDLLKLDIEGCELAVIKDIVSTGDLPKIICVEIHNENEIQEIIELLCIKNDYYYDFTENVYTFVRNR